MNLKLAWVAALLLISIQTKAQTFHGSKVKLSTEANDSIVSVSNESAVITLNDSDNDFTFSVSLFPIVNNPDEEDSLAEENNLLQLTFEGQFPIENFSFYSDKNDDNPYSMNGLLTANEFTTSYTLSFTIRTPIKVSQFDEDNVISEHDPFYPALISFIITINPADFNLDAEPIAFKKDVIVEIEDGIINKQY